MQITLALLAIATSSLLLGWIGLRDAKRLRVQDGGSASRRAFTTARRRGWCLPRWPRVSC